MSAAAKKQMSENSLMMAAKPHWNRRVLLVDDEPDILNAYENLLAPKSSGAGIQSSRRSSAAAKPANPAANFDVVRAESFDEAIIAVKQAEKDGMPFAMAFFDVRLGEQRDGVELAKEVQLLDPRIGVVFVTAYNDRSLDSIASVLGDDLCDQWDFVNKPFNDNEIVQKARNLTALWNLKREMEAQELAMADLNRRVLQSERITSVAAVARGVTHEFGNLLMQIIGNAEISRAKPEEQMREALDKIVDAGMRASEILDRFNNLSDNKSGKALKQITQVDALLSEALDLMSHLLKKQSVKVVIDLKAVLGVNIHVHSTSLLQVFINLLINSSHALENQKDRVISVFAEDLGAQLRLTFKDNGPGAPEDLLTKLTEPLFTTKGPKGTGLGLAICKEIIEIDHQGEFKVANAKDGGFEVSITLSKAD